MANGKKEKRHPVLKIVLGIVIAIVAIAAVGAVYLSRNMDTILRNGMKKNREKIVENIKANFDVRGEEFMVPREGEKSIQTYLYYPEGGGENLPILINLHGGMWYGGDALTLDSQSGKYADELNCLVVNLNYTKSDEEPFPYCQYEARDVIEYFMDHAQDFNADRNRVAIMGGSAGGQITAVGVQLAHDDGYDVSCQILLYPFVDFTFSGKEYEGLSDEAKTVDASGSEKENENVLEKMWFTNITRDDPLASPALRKDLSGLAPAIIVACGQDFLAPQAYKYHRVLTEAGVQSELLYYENAKHGFTELNYPESIDGEGKGEDQKELMLICEEDIRSRLRAIWAIN